MINIAANSATNKWKNPGDETDFWIKNEQGCSNLQISTVEVTKLIFDAILYGKISENSVPKRSVPKCLNVVCL
jgi:hypothetical protein